MLKAFTSTNSQKLYFIIAGILVSFIILVAGLFYYIHEANRIRFEKYNELRAISALKRADIRGWIDERKAEALFFSTNPAFRRHTQNIMNGIAVNKANDYFNSRLSVIQKSHHYENIRIITPDSTVLFSLNPAHTDIDSMSLYFVNKSLSQKQIITSEFYICSRHEKPHLDFVAPIMNDENNAIAALVLHIDPDIYLYPFIQTWPTPSQSAETLILRQENDHILFLNELRHKKNTALKFRIASSNIQVPSVQAALGHQGIFEGEDYRHVAVLSDIERIPGTPWYMVAKVDKVEIFKELHTRAIGIGTFILLMVLFSTTFIVLLYNNNQKRIYKNLYSKENELVQSQLEYKTTLYSIGDGVIKTDCEGMIQQMNPLAAQLTGWSEKSALGRPLTSVFNIIHEKDKTLVDNPVHMVIETGEKYKIPAHSLLLSKNGKEIPISDSAAPIKDDKGHIIGVVIVYHDQSSERAAQQALEESEEKYRHLVESSIDAIFINHGEIIQYLNPAACKLLKINNPNKIIGKSLIDIVHKSYHEQITKTIRMKHQYESVPETFDAQLVYQDGDPVDVEIAINSFKLKNRHAVQIIIRDITERKNAVKALQKSENLLNETQKITKVGGWEYNIADNQILWTEQTYTIHGIDRKNINDSSDLFEKSLLCYDENDRETLKNLFQECIQNGTPYDIELPLMNHKSEQLWVRTIGKAVRQHGAITKIVGNFIDITERKKIENEKEKLQTQLVQSQKMDAVGNLAGGVAHDFNNMLNVITGYAEMAIETVDKKDEIYENLQRILEAASKSTALTRQLLAFARKQSSKPQIVNINDTIVENQKMLQRLVGEDISLKFFPGENIWKIKVDVSQIDQILMNLAVNARDAIATTGTIGITIQNVVIDQRYSDIVPDLQPGEYVKINFSDTGVGIPHEIQPKIFDPFFTTKEKGKGTGLGLSTVYGIVKQNNGFISVYSEPDKGTVFKIYFPRCKEEDVFEKNTAASIELKGTETIMVVEDEEQILSICKSILENNGYKVYTAQAPEKALEIVQEQKIPIHLLITDVIMPNMSGRELNGLISQLLPNMKTLFMSGYTSDVVAHRGLLDENVHYIQKPFNQKDFLTKVRNMLNNSTS